MLSTHLLQVYCQNFPHTDLLQIVSTSSLVTSLQVTSLILTNLLQLVDKLQQAGKIDNLQQVGSVFGCVIRHPFLLKYFKTLSICLPKAALDHCEDHNIKPASSNLIAQAILTIDNGIVSSFCAHVTNTFSRR